MDINKYIAMIITTILALTGSAVLVSRAEAKSLLVAELFIGSLLIIFGIFIWILMLEDTSISWLLSTFYFSFLLFFILFVYFNASKGILVMIGSITVGMTGLAISSTSVGIISVSKEEGIEEWKANNRADRRESDVRYEIKRNAMAKSALADKGEETFYKSEVSMQHVENKEHTKSENIVNTENVIDTKEFSLGKYIASKKGKKFHMLKCGWTQKIISSNKIWLKDKQNALEHGLEPCYCVR